MLKEFLWETFKKTGDIEVYIAYKELEEKNLLENGEKDVEKNVEKTIVMPVIS